MGFIITCGISERRSTASSKLETPLTQTIVAPASPALPNPSLSLASTTPSIPAAEQCARNCFNSPASSASADSVMPLAPSPAAMAICATSTTLSLTTIGTGPGNFPFAVCCSLAMLRKRSGPSSDEVLTHIAEALPLLRRGVGTRYSTVGYKIGCQIPKVEEYCVPVSRMLAKTKQCVCIHKYVW
jgi:hypothetical protein